MTKHTGRKQDQWDAYIRAEFGKQFALDRFCVERVNCSGTERVSVFTKKSDAQHVYAQWEVVGPLGGVISRRHFVERRWYDGHGWALPDPAVHALGLRGQLCELRTEPLFVDQRVESGNALRYVSDYRDGEAGLLELALIGSLDTVGAPNEPGSRPGSPGSPGSRPGTREGAAQLAKERKRAAKEREREESTIRQRINCKFVEVAVDGWPYVVCVATRSIGPGEELVADRGANYLGRWTHALQQVHLLGRVSSNLLGGTSAPLPLDAPPSPTFSPRKGTAADGTIRAGGK